METSKEPKKAETKQYTAPKKLDTIWGQSKKW